MGRRIRLRQLKAQAAATMSQAQQTLAKADKTLQIADRAILQIQAQAMAVLVEALDWLESGIELEVEAFGRKMPVSVHLKKDEDE